jgi:RNA polymerase sigma-70 factor, ECF subfamily
MIDQRTLTADELISLAQKGELHAFTTLYEQYLPIVYNRVRYVIPTSDVEDVTQEIFITLLKSLGSFKGQAQFTTWLRTLTNRRVADYYRQRARTATTVDADLSDMSPVVNRELGVESETAASEEEMVLRQAMRALPDHYREILLLRFAEDMKFQDIARLQGQSLEGTKSLFRRAITALRNQIGVIDV